MGKRRRSTVISSSCADAWIRSLKAAGNETIAAHSRGFFKANPGEYGEGDEFLGIRVPVIRQQVKENSGDWSLPLAVDLLASKYHEVRLAGCIVLVNLYKKQPDECYRTYLEHKERVNGWDLVDTSAHKIVGPYLMSRDRKILYDLAGSESLWDRRIAVIACFAFIKENDFEDIVALSTKLLEDKEDLIHKATGWMLREAGKRDEAVLTSFLDRHCLDMPRVMLRYAIEKLPEKARKEYLNRKRDE